MAITLIYYHLSYDRIFIMHGYQSFIMRVLPPMEGPWGLVVCYYILTITLKSTLVPFPIAFVLFMRLTKHLCYLHMENHALVKLWHSDLFHNLGINLTFKKVGLNALWISQVVQGLVVQDY
jgi:hypothetical protein